MNILKSKKLSQLEGNVGKESFKTSFLLKSTLRISIPAALETFLVGLMGMIDTMMVGQYSTEAFAAVSIAQQPVYITLAASVGFNAGIIAIVSRRKGENDPKSANQVLRHTLIIGMIVSILITILAIVFARPFLWLVGAQDDTIDFATTYFRFVSAGLIFNYIRLIICSGQRAIGKTNITLVTNVVSNVVNVFFNYCMITGHLGFKEMGVMGAAIATDIGNIVACIIAFFSVFHAKGFLSIHLLDDWRLSKSVIKNILNVSMAAFIEQLFMRVGFFIIAMIVNRLGTHTTAVNSVITNMMNMNFNITDGFAIGAGALVGRALGEKDLQKAFAYGRISQILSVVIAIITMILVIIFRYPLSRCFSNDESVVREAGDYIIYTSVIMLPQSLQWVTTGILRGAGDTKYTAKNSIISVTFIRPVFAYVLCYPLKFGLLGSWAGMLVDQIIRCICNNVRFVNLKWMKLKV